MANFELNVGKLKELICGNEIVDIEVTKEESNVNIKLVLSNGDCLEITDCGTNQCEELMVSVLQPGAETSKFFGFLSFEQDHWVN